MITRILLALIYVQNSITMPYLAVIQFMRVIKWPRSDSGGSCVNKNVCGNKGFYSTTSIFLRVICIRYMMLGERVHAQSSPWAIRGSLYFTGTNPVESRK